MAALTEGSIPASFGRSVDGIWRSSYETQKIETAEQKCRRLGNYCNSTNQKTVKFTICGDCDGRCMRCMRGSISSLLSLWFVLSGGCSFARFRNNCNLAILRNLWVQCRRSREVLLAILYQWAYDGKLWSCCATRRKNTLEHCVKMKNELGARNCRTRFVFMHVTGHVIVRPRMRPRAEEFPCKADLDRKSRPCSRPSRAHSAVPRKDSPAHSQNNRLLQGTF